MNCSFGSEDSVCGPFGTNSTILPLVKCEEDMTSHLISLGVSSKRGRRRIPPDPPLVPLSYETVEREASQKNVLSEDSI